MCVVSLLVLQRARTRLYSDCTALKRDEEEKPDRMCSKMATVLVLW